MQHVGRLMALEAKVKVTSKKCPRIDISSYQATTCILR